MQKKLYPQITITVEKKQNILNVVSKIEYQISQNSENSLLPVQILIDPNNDTIKNLMNDSSFVDNNIINEEAKTISNTKVIKEPNSSKKELLEHFSDKQIAKLNCFDINNNIGKAQGVTSGFIANTNEQYGYSNKTFMLKNLPNITNKDELKKSQKERSIIDMDRSDSLTEFLVADIYSLLLGKNAPKEGLVVDKNLKKYLLDQNILMMYNRLRI